MWLRSLSCVALLLLPCELLAQGLRVSTHVYDMVNRDPAGREPMISSSLSLFHNTRVYDYVDAADEVIVFDPIRKDFTILNTAREICTTLTFEEIRHLLESRVPTVENYIQDLNQQGNPSAAIIGESLRFQLRPQFEQSFDAGSGRLTLTSPTWVYRVETRPWNQPEQVEKYLTCADWTARLNHLMHPNSMFPEPRLALNQAVRELKSRIPVSVELDLEPHQKMRLRAEHRFTQDIDDSDRRRIARWEKLLNAPSLRKMIFRSYQETVLLSQNR